MKKWASVVLVMALLLTTVLGCGAKSDTGGKPGDSPGSQQADSGNNVRLTFSIAGSDDHKKMYEDLAAKFTAGHPNVEVEVMNIVNEDYDRKLSVMMASRTAPDLGWVFESTIPKLMETNQLLDVTEVLQSDKAYDITDFYPATLELLQQDGKNYGVPFSTPTTMIFYNKTMFKEKGLKTPIELYKEGNWTLEEFLKAAKALNDPSKGIYGANYLEAWKYWSSTLLPLIWAHGGDMFNADKTKVAINSPEAEKAVQFYYDMVFKEKVHPQPGGSQATFESGKVAMFKDMYSFVTKARKIKDFEWDVAPLPQGPEGRGTLMGYAGIGVFSDTKHPKEAAEFLKFLSSQESMSVTSQFFVPGRKSILESPTFMKPDQLPAPENIQIAVLDQMKEARVVPSHVKWQEINVKAQSLIDQLNTQSASVKDVLAQMENELNAILAK